MGTENNDVNLAVLAHKVDAIHANITDMQVAMRDLTNAIIKLALVEERQTQFSIAQERGFKVLEKIESKLDSLDNRVNALEAAEPEQRRTSGWIMTAVWAAAGLAVAMVLAELGIRV